ncbi:hypothetical protein M9Y10_041601 [Tritrichomonas musculus]|uniref:Transmembrane protein n=1 Tax=Tritrichomonas musculus TaxID=1915356 RepID=A0ABR2K5E2_9EUKA
MSDQQQLLDPLNKEQEPNDVNEEHEEDIQTVEYRIPRIPAYTAYALNRVYYYTTPYWIFEFLIYIVKSNLIRDGVSARDWVILFFWLVAQIISRHFAILSIKQGTCSFSSYFTYYVPVGIISIFFTIYIFQLANTVLLFEIIFTVIVLIFQIALFVGSVISFLMQLSPSKVKVT